MHSRHVAFPDNYSQNMTKRNISGGKCIRLYTVSQKKRRDTLVHIFAKYWQISQFFQRRTQLFIFWLMAVEWAGLGLT